MTMIYMFYAIPFDSNHIITYISLYARGFFCATCHLFRDTSKHIGLTELFRCSYNSVIILNQSFINST